MNRLRHKIFLALHLCCTVALAQLPGNGAWLSCIGDEVPLSRLSLPGAHDAATGEGLRFAAGFGKTQSLGVSQLWDCGVRAFDLRPALSDGKLHIYHGPVKTNISFDEALGILCAKLEQQPQEFAIVLLRNEGKACAEWGTAIGEAIAALGDKAALFSPAMCVGDVRGKVLFLSRDAYTGTDRGGLITGWNHSVDGSCNAAIHPCTGGSAAPLCQQDFYNASGDGVQEKKCEAVMHGLSIAGNAPIGTWVINFLSAYRTTWLGCTPFATTTGYKRNAQVVNTLVAEHLEQAGKAPTGILFMDYAGVDEAPGGIWHWGEFNTAGSRLVQLIIEQNFR